MTDEELLNRLDKIESGHRDLNGLILDLRESTIVTAGIQQRRRIQLGARMAPVSQ